MVPFSAYIDDSVIELSSELDVVFIVVDVVVIGEDVTDDV
jgi:hypothetical protein